MLTNRESSLTVDFTANRVYKLTDNSLEQVKNINKDVTVYVLTDEANFESINDYYLQINKLSMMKDYLFFYRNNHKLKETTNMY